MSVLKARDNLSAMGVLLHTDREQTLVSREVIISLSQVEIRWLAAILPQMPKPTSDMMDPNQRPIFEPHHYEE
jgi:hypothetical protein